MTRIQQVDDVNEVIIKWPRLLALEQPESPEILLRMFLKCLQSGAVFFAYGDRGLMGTCCVEICGDFLNLLSLPRDNGVGMGKECLAYVIEWARKLGVDELRVTSTNLCGSNFKYFEKSLGFRRHTMTFQRKF